MNVTVTKNPFLTEEFAKFFKVIGNTFLYRKSENCSAYIYKRKINLFSFAKFMPEFPVTFPIIGIPASIESSGISGSQKGISEFLDSFWKKLPFFLILNANNKFRQDKILWDNTLPNILFINRFSTFDDYLCNLRSDYRNKLKKIIKKTQDYAIQIKKNEDFNKLHYKLYEKTFERSNFPLEKLPYEFFSKFPEKANLIEIKTENQKIIGFAFITIQEKKCYFLFGGTESKYKFPDLYARLLLEILKHGIKKGCSEISFGQTAEDIKLKLGCIIESKFAGLWIRSKILRKIVSAIISSISYQYKIPEYRVYKKQ